MEEVGIIRPPISNTTRSICTALENDEGNVENDTKFSGPLAFPQSAVCMTTGHRSGGLGTRIALVTCDSGWALRVEAYLLLLVDEYPPFALD